MAIIGHRFPDLLDLYKSTDGGGEWQAIMEMLAKEAPELSDALWVECNQGKQHLTTVRTGLPEVAWGRLYKGIPNSKSSRAQVTDTTGFCEGRSTVDARLIDELSDGKGPQLRLSEAEGFLQSMSQELSSKIFYGNDIETPDQFMGLAPRFSDKTAPNGSQIIDAGGSNDTNTSIWFLTWGDNQTSLIYPKGTRAGLIREDHGKQRVIDEDGNAYYAYEETFRQHIGLSVRDWRYNARIANIDIDDVKAGTVDLYGLMRKAYYRLQNRRNKDGNIAIYLNRDMLEALDALATNSGSSDNFVRLTRREVEGEEILSYRGIPLRETDALINTEEDVA